MKGAILALGSINADFQVRVDQSPGRADMLLAHDMRRLGGGKAANVAYLARMLGHDAFLFGRVGDDDLSDQALAPMRALHVDIHGVTRAMNHQTGMAMIVVPPSGKKRIVLAANANDDWSEEATSAMCKTISHASKACVLVADCEVPAGVVKAAARAARRRGIRVVLDPSFASRVDDELLALVDAITPNESEAHQLLGKGAGKDPADVARALSARGPAIVCLKLSDGGCLLVHEDRLHHLRADNNAPVVDTTGAGDAFTGAFAVACLEGRPPLEGARFAVAASSLAVTAYGSQPSYPRREAIEARLHGQPHAPKP